MTSYPSRRSPRLHDYDYSSAGAYFVTLCVQNKLSLLGHVDDDIMHLSPAGMMVASIWANLEPYYGVGVDAYVVMPNHVHGILVVPNRGATRADRDGATVPTETASSVPPPRPEWARGPGGEGTAAIPCCSPPRPRTGEGVGGRGPATYQTRGGWARR